MPDTISEEYGSGQYFLRGLSREMQHMAAGPEELCSPCEPCSCGESCQAQEDASLKILMRQKGEARISVNKWLQTFFYDSPSHPPPAVELSVWPVALAPFLSRLWKSCWKLMLPLLLSFSLFFLFSSSAYGCWQGMSFRCEQKSVAERLLIEPSFVEGEGLQRAGVPGNAVGSWSAANPEVLAAACFCTHCLLTGAWWSSP